MENPTPLETPELIQKTSRFLLPASALILLLIVTAVGMYTWYYLYNPCEVNAVKDATAFLISQRNSYDNAYQFAATASRTSLDRPVNTLKQIFMDTKEVVVPACMQTAKNELINYMGAVIRAFQAFGAQEADATIRDLVNQSDTHYENFTTELEAVNKCAPFCAPWD
jgi:hypothetical protein